MMNRDRIPATASRYEIIQTTLTHSELGTFTTYGLQAISEENGQSIETIPDISTDYEFVVRTAELLNHHKLSQIHFFEYISDII